MGISDTIISEISKISDANMVVRNGRAVPSTEDIALRNGAMELEAAYLYADLANSSMMARYLDRRVTAKILKSFLASSARLIRHCGGRVMSFDGDRVMGSFVGADHCDNAVKCAFAISWAVDEVIRPKLEGKYDSIKAAGIEISHATGVDVGTVYVVRAGVRGSNDLVSIGRAPNLAAKLSDIRASPFTTYVTGTVHRRMSASCKTQLNGGRVPWEGRNWSFVGETVSYYRTGYWRKP